MNYNSIYKNSVENPNEFWKAEAKKIDWFEFPKTILGEDKNKVYEWFKDGKINMSYLCLDKHIKDGNGDRIAIYYDSPVTNTKRKITYNELHHEVCKFAGVLKSFGVKKGDTIIIYMPMIPDAVVAMLASARLGAIHSVVFGGFAPHELQIRIDDCKPKVLISASCGIEINKVINYKELVDKAVNLAEHKPQEIIYYHREQMPITIVENNEHIWQDLMKTAVPFEEPVILNGNDNLYILYTSGTTGRPKGVVRQCGGYAVSLNFSMKFIYDCDPGDVYWAASDIGWVVGHSYIVYAPLIYGCSSVFYEGKPIKTPDAGAFWRIISEYKVKAFFTAPTAFRAIKKEDPDGDFLKKYDIKCLKNIFLAGERLDPPTLFWLENLTQKPVYDHWWQTESGSGIVANPIGIKPQKVKSGSSTFPVCGYVIDILDENGNKLPPNEEGYICLKLPLPPGFMCTLWNGFDDYNKYYLSKFPGYYLTGDGGYIDEDGYVFIMGRVDDVINVAGHRLSTGEMEQIIGMHPAVAESAVIGIDDELRGQVPMSFYVLKDNVTTDLTVIENELIEMVKNEIGAIAVFKKAIRVKRLPKTRSGKILRRTMREMSQKEKYVIPSTIEDITVLDEIKEVMVLNKIGRFS